MIGGSPSRGFTVAEVLLALALSVVVILALLGLGLTAVTSNSKSNDLVAGQFVADQQLRELIYAASGNSTAGLWSANSVTAPYQVDIVNVSGNSYTVSIYAVDVAIAITPAPPEGLKRIQAIATWWPGDQGAKAGYGQLQASATQVVNVP